jgi:tripartite-type tricarboxylate transporter receptor subunit TctC
MPAPKDYNMQCSCFNPTSERRREPSRLKYLLGAPDFRNGSLPAVGPLYLGHGIWDSLAVTKGRTVKLLRRNFLKFAGAALAAPAFPRLASADDYPARPVRIIAGFAAGGGVDITARLIGQWLTERLGQSFVTENRPGAGGNIGTEAVVNAAPDGYTLLLATVPNVVNASLYDKLNFNFIRDIAPVAGIIRVPMVILLNPSVPARTVPEFISYAKANPGKVNMASAGNGSAPHLAGDLFKMMAGVDLVHVPYRGQGPALTDLLGGQVQVLFATTPGTTDYISTGKLRALAVTSASRAEMLPELPTVGDFVPGYETSNGMASAHPETRRLKSSTSSTGKSMRPSPTPG